MDGINVRRYGISPKPALALGTIKSSDRDTRALAAQGKRQKLNVGLAYCLWDFANKSSEKIWVRLYHCILLDPPHVIEGHCRVSKKTIGIVWGMI